jgi:hypothetical protein
VTKANPVGPCRRGGISDAALDHHPGYNEAESLPAILARLRPIVRGMDCDYELIFVDDGAARLGRCQPGRGSIRRFYRRAARVVWPRETTSARNRELIKHFKADLEQAP